MTGPVHGTVASSVLGGERSGSPLAEIPITMRDLRAYVRRQPVRTELYYGA
jgi:hypothetical protein